MNEVPKFSMRTVAVHEGVPGHHFQISIAQQQKGAYFQNRAAVHCLWRGLGAVRRMARQLKLGLYSDDPFGDVGRLHYELLRAARLVVDTGIHAQALDP